MYELLIEEINKKIQYLSELHTDSELIKGQLIGLYWVCMRIKELTLIEQVDDKTLKM